MCGRFALTLDYQQLLEGFAVRESWEYADEPWTPRYNICPTQFIPIVRRRDDGARELVPARWGLVPSWATGPDDPRINRHGPLINARSETAWDLPVFRDSARTRHCLVPASGFFEWKGDAPPKTPFFIGVDGAEVMAMAGVWDAWRDPGGAGTIESVTILTCAPNAFMSGLHDRMPVILKPRDYERWLLATPGDERLARPFEGAMFARRISTRVNRVANDDPSILDEEREPDEADGTLWGG